MKPPTIAPAIPRTMSTRKPSPALLTILLAMKPAIRPRTIHPIIDIIHLACLERLLGRGRAVYHRFALGCSVLSSGQYLDGVGARPEAADEGRTLDRSDLAHCLRLRSGRLADRIRLGIPERRKR